MTSDDIVKAAQAKLWAGEAVRFTYDDDTHTQAGRGGGQRPARSWCSRDMRRPLGRAEALGRVGIADTRNAPLAEMKASLKSYQATMQLLIRLPTSRSSGLAASGSTRATP